MHLLAASFVSPPTMHMMAPVRPATVEPVMQMSIDGDTVVDSYSSTGSFAGQNIRPGQGSGMRWNQFGDFNNQRYNQYSDSRMRGGMGGYGMRGGMGGGRY